MSDRARPGKATLDTHYSRTIAELGPGDHVCCLYETEEEHRTVLTPFLRQGLERGEKVLYIVDAHTAEAVLGYLRDDGLDVGAYLARGQLAILTRDDAYMRQGLFDPDGMIALLRAETERALAQGYPALRVTGEMTWALRGLPGSERLLEYEAKLNEFFPGSNCLAICQYDQRAFSPAMLLDVLCTHPIAVVGTAVYDNFYYVPPADFLGDDPPAAQLGHWVEHLAERIRMEEALRESEARYRLLAENTSDLIWTMDLGLRYTYMSPSITHMRGYTVEEIMGSTAAETMTLASLEVARKTLAEELAMERMEDKDILRSRTLELEMYCRDGSTIWTEMNMKFLRDPDGRPMGILGVTRDVTERKKAEEEREGLHAELELRAITDSLTGLYDHAHFYQRLAEEIERSKRYKHGFALLMMDIDDFKRFNDSHGHNVGDEMLRLVARCIPAGLRRSDLAFRYGGDEFAAILPHADTSKARAAVNRMNRRIAERLKQMDGEPGTRLSLSAGVACFPNDGATADELVRIADATLYNAKWVARARDIMGQREDVQSLVSTLVSRQGGAEGSAGETVFRPEALHEQQARIVSSVASSIAVALKDAGVAQALEDPDLQVLATVGAAAEIKDRYIRGHPERMSEWAVALAEEMGLSPERVRDIRIAALLHDIGKITVSEGILNKPGKLTRREFASIKDHPIVGATLVSQVKGFERLVPIVRHHHERFDGTGYPDGLAGEDIPPESRILSVLDVFDALTHQRSYRKAQSQEEALAKIEDGAGTQFDPAVVKAFLSAGQETGPEVGSPRTSSEPRQAAGGCPSSQAAKAITASWPPSGEPSAHYCHHTCYNRPRCALPNPRCSPPSSRHG